MAKVTKDFLVTQKQMFGARGHRALLFQGPEQGREFDNQ